MRCPTGWMSGVVHAPQSRQYALRRVGGRVELYCDPNLRVEYRLRRIGSCTMRSFGVFLEHAYPLRCRGATNTAWASIGAGYYHTCAARLDDGTAECWGSNGDNEATPPNGVSFSVISGGEYLTCGTSRDTGFPVCFGSNSNSEVSGAPSTTSLIAIASGCALLCYHNTKRARVVSCNPLEPPLALQSHHH